MHVFIYECVCIHTHMTYRRDKKKETETWPSKTTMRYRFASTKMAIIKNTDNNKYVRMRRNRNPQMLLVGM